MLVRGGRPVRFLADWNFRLIPGVSRLYARSGAITVTRKDAKPRILNPFKPLFETEIPPLEEAARHLSRGGSVAIFPEGTVNRNAQRLLRGRRGAARLSLAGDVPVVPVGIRFGKQDESTGDLDSSSAMSIRIGKAMPPPVHPGKPVTPRSVTDWNAQVMAEIGRLCGKSWTDTEPRSPSPSTDVSATVT
jgi:1-acyl-sn-glycerol-3-phosphate acyltransferase